jgi:predicted metal-dependent peptidase
VIGGEVIDIEVDCQVHDVRKITQVRQVHMKGGGGTDMGVGINHAAKIKPRLDLCVVLTDGFTPWPETKPPFKCIVVLTQESQKDSVPEWAKTIVVN